MHPSMLAHSSNNSKRSIHNAVTYFHNRISHLKRSQQHGVFSLTIEISFAVASPFNLFFVVHSTSAYKNFMGHVIQKQNIPFNATLWGIMFHTVELILAYTILTTFDSIMLLLCTVYAYLFRLYKAIALNYLCIDQK